MKHNFIKNTCENCGLRRTKVDRSTTDYGSRTSMQWGYFRLPDAELYKNIGTCK